MTKKDYQAFADMFRTFAGADGTGEGVYTCPETLALARETCRVFARDNARFDRERYLLACGVRTEDI